MRSEGGIRSGLEDLDLSTDLKPVEARDGDASTAGLAECPADEEASFESLAGQWDCGSDAALDSSAISCAGTSEPSVGNCPPRCIRMWCWSIRALVNLRWHRGHEF